MEICRWASLTYVDYCYFFQVGTLSHSGDIKILRPGRRIYMYTLPPIYERSIKRRKTVNEMGGNIIGGNFLGGNFLGGNFPGGSLMNGNFPSENGAITK